MAACGMGHSQEEEDFFSTKRIDLSFYNAGSNHMPAKKRLNELVITGKPVSIRPLRTELVIDINQDERKTGLQEEESEEWDEKIDEYDRMPTTLFSTVNTPKSSKKKKTETRERQLSQVEENKILEHAERLEKVGAIPKQEELPMDGRGRRQTLVTTATGKVISKKLATAEELEGCIIAHMYFCTMRGNRNFPPLIISVPRDWPFIKMMRKALAGMQKTINKGERPSHDWIYNYHVNKDKPKIMRDLKVLVGDKKVEYRGSNLKKKLDTAALEPFVNRFWILPRKVEKNPYYRGRR